MRGNPATEAVTEIAPEPSTVSDVAARPSAPVWPVGVPRVPSCGSAENVTVAPGMGWPLRRLLIARGLL